MELKYCEKMRMLFTDDIVIEKPTIKEEDVYSDNGTETPNQSVTRLQEVPLRTSTDVVEDKYFYFETHVSSQLRKPTRSFIILQEKIQNLISEERLKSLVYPEIGYSSTPSIFAQLTSSPFNLEWLEVGYSIVLNGNKYITDLKYTFV